MHIKLLPARSCRTTVRNDFGLQTQTTCGITAGFITLMAVGEAALFDMLRVTVYGINKWKCFGIYIHIYLWIIHLETQDFGSLKHGFITSLSCGSNVEF